MSTVLSFRSLDLLADGIQLHLTQGFLLPPTMRGTDHVIAARAGRSSGNRVADTLRIMLEGYVSGDTADDWREATDALLAVLDENGADPGDLVVTSPYYGLGSGTAQVTARVKNVVEGPIYAFKYQSWSIELESVDPYWTVTPAP